MLVRNILIGHKHAYPYLLFLKCKDNLRKNKSSQYTAVSRLSVFVVIFTFYYLFALSIHLQPPPPRLPPSNADVGRFWDTHSFMQRYWYVHSRVLLGVGLKICITEENMNL